MMSSMDGMHLITLTSNLTMWMNTTLRYLKIETGSLINMKMKKPRKMTINLKYHLNSNLTNVKNIGKRRTGCLTLVGVPSKTQMTQGRAISHTSLRCLKTLRKIS